MHALVQRHHAQQPRREQNELKKQIPRQKEQVRRKKTEEQDRRRGEGQRRERAEPARRAGGQGAVPLPPPRSTQLPAKARKLRAQPLFPRGAVRRMPPLHCAEKTSPER